MPSPVTRTSPACALALTIALLSCLTVIGAWVFQWSGYAPCELCLKGRIPHYAGTALAIATALIARRDRRSLLPAAFAGLGLIYAGGTLFSLYHAGVEWHLWPGPSSCAGTYNAPSDVGDLLNQLKTATVVRCDAPALHVLGLSLAVWNALICLALAVLAAFGFAGTIRSP